MRPDITHRRRETGSDLALKVNVPLLHVISPGIRFHIRAGEGTCTQLRIGTPWIGGGNAERPGEWISRRIGNNTDESERCLDALLRVIVSRQRQNIEDGEAATNGHLAITVRIPGKAESRLKIASGGI